MMGSHRYIRRSTAFPSRVVAILLLILVIAPSPADAEFNYEVEKRIVDRLTYYMSQAVDTNKIISNFRYSGGFANNLAAPDRDAYLVLDNSLPMPLIYYGLEDGSITGYYKGGTSSMGYYREPGNSGYDASDPLMGKHLRSCIDKNDGSPTECLLSPGDAYVECINDCELVLCPDEDSQRDCSVLEGTEETSECSAKQKWCPQYRITTHDDNVTRGFIPLTNYCHDIRGLFTQEPGKTVIGYTPSTYDLGAVVNPADGSSAVHKLGDCYHADGTTLVNRSLAWDYAYCGNSGEQCDTAFVGGYESNEYDPRYRPWYIDTKAGQKAEWLDPYPFFDLGLGITNAHPIYDIVDGKNVFAGVLAVDYRFEDISAFLIDSYGGTDTMVAIYEDKDPNYIIALSTGTAANSLVLTEDPTTPCPVDSGTDVPCDPVRVQMADLTGNEQDDVLAKAYEKHLEAGYPKELITVRSSSAVDADIYLSQSALYEQFGANLRWRVVIASPGERSESDAILKGHPLFPTMLVIGVVGFVICMVFFAIFYRKRHKRAVLYSDYRFTGAFLLGCAVFNCATLTLVGPNTNPLCMLRMWSFHVLLVIPIAFLLVKTWRMWRLVGTSNIQRKSISNAQAVAYALPMIGLQIVILLIISLTDPPLQTEETKISEGTLTQHVVCSHQTVALPVVEIIYEAGLVLTGCILSFQTRHMDPRFGESKQLIFSMYTWGLVGFSFLVVAAVAEITPNGASLLQGVGTFWVTVFSSAAFVIPRLIQVRRDDSERGSGPGRVSGWNSSVSRGGAPVSIMRSSNMRSSNMRSSRRSFDEEEDDEEEGGESEKAKSASSKTNTLSVEERPAGIPVSRRSVTFDDEASVET